MWARCFVRRHRPGSPGRGPIDCGSCSGAMLFPPQTPSKSSSRLSVSLLPPDLGRELKRRGRVITAIEVRRPGFEFEYALALTLHRFDVFRSYVLSFQRMLQPVLFCF